MDLLLDENLNRLALSGGDLVIGDATSQNIALLMGSKPGDWRFSPLSGGGLMVFLHKTNSGFDGLKRHIADQIIKDGGQPGRISVSDSGVVDIEATY